MADRELSPAGHTGGVLPGRLVPGGEVIYGSAPCVIISVVILHTNIYRGA
jgi:hypothetical protein